MIRELKERVLFGFSVSVVWEDFAYLEIIESRDSRLSSIRFRVIRVCSDFHYADIDSGTLETYLLLDRFYTSILRNFSSNKSTAVAVSNKICFH